MNNTDGPSQTLPPPPAPQEARSPAALYRSEGQRNIMRGAHSIRWITILICSMFIAKAFLSHSAGGVFLLYMAVLPVCIILAVLRYQKESEISLDLMLEMFWAGSFISCGLAMVFEIFGQFLTKDAWKCQVDSHESLSFFCDAWFIIVVIATVGLTEEFVKIVPLSILKVKEIDLPFTCTVFYRLVDSPYGFVMAGCATAGGFATLENIKYVFSASSFDGSLGTSIGRAILAIPFHIACTGYAASRIASIIFDPRNPDFEYITQRTPVGSDTEGTTNQILLGSYVQPLSNLEIISARRYNSFSYPPISSYIKIVMVPAVLHGIYDSGLFLFPQILGVRKMSSWSSVLPYSVYSDYAAQWTSEEPSGDVSSLRVFLAFSCLGASLLSHLGMIILFVVGWCRLSRLVNPSLYIIRTQHPPPLGTSTALQEVLLSGHLQRNPLSVEEGPPS